MTTEHELDEILRRALHAAVDSVEPAGDGLQRIRHKLDKPRWQLQLHLWLTECADLARLVGIRLAPAASAVSGWGLTVWATLAGWLHGERRLAAGGSAARHGAAHRSQPPGRLAGLLRGLRPALAVAGAVVVVVAGVFGLFQLRSGVTSINLLGGGGGSSSPSAGPAAHHHRNGHTSTPSVVASSPRLTPTPHARGTRHRPSSPTPTCTPRAASQPQGTPSPTATPNPTGTASVTPSPSDSGLPSPTAVALTPQAATSVSPAGTGASSGPAHRLSSGCNAANASAGSASSSATP